MEKKPSIFKPNISNKINNNKKVYYSFIEESIPNLDERNKIANLIDWYEKDQQCHTFCFRF